MILSFSKAQFMDRIIDGTKIHTIRLDPKCRWKKGMTIQFWRGNPRNKGSYQFGTAVVDYVNRITLNPENERVQWAFCF